MACTPLSEIYNSSDFQQQMKNFFDDLDIAASDFKTRFDEATSGLQDAIDTADKVISKIECLPSFIFRDPKFKRYKQYAEFLKTKVAQASALKNFASNIVSELGDIVEQIFQNIPIPLGFLRDKFKDVFEALDSVVEKLNEFQTQYAAVRKFLNTGVSTIICLIDDGEPDTGVNDPTSPIAKALQEYKDLTKKVDDYNKKFVDAVNSKLKIINLFSGDGCIDITK
jgi:hypothetical protein